MSYHVKTNHPQDRSPSRFTVRSWSWVRRFDRWLDSTRKDQNRWLSDPLSRESVPTLWHRRSGMKIL